MNTSQLTIWGRRALDLLDLAAANIAFVWGAVVILDVLSTVGRLFVRPAFDAFMDRPLFRAASPSIQPVQPFLAAADAAYIFKGVFVLGLMALAAAGVALAVQKFQKTRLNVLFALTWASGAIAAGLGGVAFGMLFSEPEFVPILLVNAAALAITTYRGIVSAYTVWPVEDLLPTGLELELHFTRVTVVSPFGSMFGSPFGSMFTPPYPPGAPYAGPDSDGYGDGPADDLFTNTTDGTGSRPYGFRRHRHG